MILAVALIVGIVAFQKFFLTSGSLISIAAALSVLAVACQLLRRLFTASALVCLAFIFAGATLAALDRHKRSDDLGVLLDRGVLTEGEPVELTGVLAQQPEAAPQSFYLTLSVEGLNLNNAEQRIVGTVSLLLLISSELAEAQYSTLELRYGARVRVLTTLRRTDTFRNPGGSSFTDYLDRKGFAATGLVKSPLLIQRLEDKRVMPPLAWLYDWRQRLQQRINLHFGPETAGVLNASVLGNRYFLSRESSERFREGGTFHVLVISGLHISFIGGLVLLLARKISKRRLTQFVMSAVVLWSYAIAVGAEASVVRAALMFTFVAFAPVISRRAASLNALGAAALILLAWRPRDLFDPSFQLTFLSVAAIVVFAWPLLQRMSEVGSWRPTRAHPYPPSCPRWFRVFCETLFWQEKKWRRELSQLNYRYRLLKTPLALRLERYHLQSLVRYGFGAVLVSFCVQITMLPLLVVYFHRLSISALVLNIGVSVIMALIIFTGLAALLIAELKLSAALLISLTNGLQWLMVHGVDPFSRIGIASMRLPEYSGAWSAINALFFVPLVILAIALAYSNPLAAPGESKARFGCRVLVKTAAFLQALFFAVIVFHPFSAAKGDGKLRIDFLDVGQGDAALVTMPDGTTLLVDGGGRPKFRQRNSEPETGREFERDSRSIGEAVVSEYLWWRGLGQVDYLLATHADADHMEGLGDVARNFHVRAALVARTPASDPEFAEFTETLRRERIPVQVIGKGDRLCLGGVRADVLWPPPSGNDQARSANDDSIVLQFEFGDHRILLLADIERKSEQALVETPANVALTADVVKVAHHGSRTSSTEQFVKAVTPKLAIISVGQRSMFGHPHKEVVDRWRDVGAQILTTGENGMITAISDGRELTVETFVGAR